MHALFQAILEYPVTYLASIPQLLKSRSETQLHFRHILTSVQDNHPEHVDTLVELIIECQRRKIYKRDIENAIYLTEEAELLRIIEALKLLVLDDIPAVYPKVSGDTTIPILEYLLPNDVMELKTLLNILQTLQEGLNELNINKGSYEFSLQAIMMAILTKLDIEAVPLSEEENENFKKIATSIPNHNHLAIKFVGFIYKKNNAEYILQTLSTVLQDLDDIKKHLALCDYHLKNIEANIAELIKKNPSLFTQCIQKPTTYYPLPEWVSNSWILFKSINPIKAYLPLDPTLKIFTEKSNPVRGLFEKFIFFQEVKQVLSENDFTYRRLQNLQELLVSQNYFMQNRYCFFNASEQMSLSKMMPRKKQHKDLELHVMVNRS